MTLKDKILTNSVQNANFSTRAPVQERKPGGHRDTEDRSPAQGDNVRNDTDLRRGQELLSRQVDRSTTDAPASTIGSMAEARERVTALQQAIAADPQAGLRALGFVDRNIIEAASARPSA